MLSNGPDRKLGVAGMSTLTPRGRVSSDPSSCHLLGKAHRYNPNDLDTDMRRWPVYPHPPLGLGDNHRPMW